MIFTKIASFFMAILYALTSAFSFIPSAFWYGKEEYSVADSETILLDAAFISDAHSDSDYFHDRSKLLRKVLCGISKTDYIPDALVIAGDISNASDAKEFAMLEWSMRTFNKVETVIPATGNHDVRARDTYEEARDNFCDFASFCGIETDKTYYTTSVNGYSFIILGSESQMSLESDISDEQIQWFENQLVEAMQTEKPIFIVCHQPFYNSNNVHFDPSAEKNYGIGAQSAQLEEIVRKYVPDYEYPVFFISGHLHRDYNEYSVDSSFCENLWCVNIPSITKTGEGGLGAVIEVYPDQILLRARNYITMDWLEDYQYEIPIENLEK